MKKLYRALGIIALSASLHASPAFAQCPLPTGGWQINPANGHWYRFTTAEGSWQSANDEATCMGAHLLTINDEAENFWVFANLILAASVSTWIGYNDAAEEGAFVWASGESPDYENWASGQPDDCCDDGIPHQQDYAVYQIDSTWIDAPGNASHYGIIEYDPNAGEGEGGGEAAPDGEGDGAPDGEGDGAPDGEGDGEGDGGGEGDPCDIPATGRLVYGANGHTYWLTHSTLTWDDALAQAQCQGGYLATINDADENTWIVANFLGLLGDEVWIGYNDNIDEGIFTWANGESPTYTNWNLDEPNDCCDDGIPHEEDTAVLNEDGTWNDEPETALRWGLIEFDAIIGEGEGTPEGEGQGGGEGTPDGEGDGAPDGEGQGGGEGTPDGEGDVEGEGIPDGEGDVEGEGPPDGEGQGGGEGTPEGEGDVDGEGITDGEGEGSPDGEAETPDGEAETPDGEAEPEGEGEANPTPVTSIDVLAAWSTADTNANGFLDFDEFFNAFAGTQEDFDLLDTNLNDLLTIAELQRQAGGQSPIHSADTNGDGVLTLTELLRVVQLYNAAGYACTPNPDTTEDGYQLAAPGVGPSCPAHASDYTDTNGRISLSELLRLVQLYNLDTPLNRCPTTEDNFCPTP